MESPNDRVTVCPGLSVTTSVRRMARLYSHKEKEQPRTPSLANDEVDPYSQWEGDIPAQLPELSLAEIKTITANFSKELGRGRFGRVFKGSWKDRDVAVKRIDELGMDISAGQFVQGMQRLYKHQHTRLIRLLACCAEGSTRIVIMEYMPGGTVMDALSRLRDHPHLAHQFGAEARLQVAGDVARALWYLHKEPGGEAGVGFVHTNVSTRNMMLDAGGRGKLGDFRITAETMGLDNGPTSPTKMSGLSSSFLGYTAPEYASSGTFSTKTDVYAFGMVLLELATGQQLLQQNWKDLASCVRQHVVESGLHVHLLCHPSTRFPVGVVQPLVQLALRCTDADPDTRPDMEEVAHTLFLLHHRTVALTHAVGGGLPGDEDKSDSSSSDEEDTDKEVDPFDPSTELLHAESLYSGHPPHVARVLARSRLAAGWVVELLRAVAADSMKMAAKGYPGAVSTPHGMPVTPQLQTSIERLLAAVPNTHADRRRLAGGDPSVLPGGSGNARPVGGTPRASAGGDGAGGGEGTPRGAGGDGGAALHALLELMATREAAAEPGMQELACFILGDVACEAGEEGLSPLIAAGAPLAVIRTLRAPTRDPGLLHAGYFALTCMGLGSNGEVGGGRCGCEGGGSEEAHPRVAMVEGGAAQAVIKSMKGHLADVRLAEMACVTLWALVGGKSPISVEGVKNLTDISVQGVKSFNDGGGRERAGGGGVPPGGDNPLSPMESPKGFAGVSGALAAPVGMEGAVPFLLSVLDLHHEHKAVANAALLALSAFAAASQAGAVEVLGEGKALARARSALTSFPASVKVSCAVCQLVANVCSHTGFLGHDIRHRALGNQGLCAMVAAQGGVRIVADAMEMVPGDRDLQCVGCMALLHLARDVEGRAAILADVAGGVALVTGAMTDHPHCRSLQALGLKVLELLKE